MITIRVENTVVDETRSLYITDNWTDMINWREYLGNAVHTPWANPYKIQMEIQIWQQT